MALDGHDSSRVFLCRLDFCHRMQVTLGSGTEGKTLNKVEHVAETTSAFRASMYTLDVT